MHLSPLTGIETNPYASEYLHNVDASFTPYGDWNEHPKKPYKNTRADASFTPYGDWNCTMIPTVAMASRCIFHPLRGLKLLSRMLTMQNVDRMHLSPLTGIETYALQCLCYSVLRCIFHPLRGLKRSLLSKTFSRYVDASFTPYGDWNSHGYVLQSLHTLMHLSPLTGIETH